MRTVVLGAIALGSGCNWVFGLDPVRLTDAQINDAPPDARLPTVKLSGITPMLNEGATTGQAILVPLAPEPTVQYGRIGEALVDTVYNGQDVPVGYEFAESAEIWRLVYTLPGRVPHEVHWKPSASTRPGHAVVLQLTASERADVPSGGVFTLSPTNPPSWVTPRVYTTNTWTLTSMPGKTATSVTASFDTAATVAIAGEKRKPDPAKDFEVVIDYKLSTDDSRCTVASGAAAFRVDLSTGMDDGVPQAFDTNAKPGTYRLGAIDASSPQTNVGLSNGLNPATDVVVYQVITYGPAGGIPLYHQREDVGVDDSIPVPPGILLALCIDRPEPDAIPGFAYPSRVPLPTIATLMFATIPLPVATGGPYVRGLVSLSTMGTQGPFDALNFTNMTLPIDPTIDGVSVKITEATTPAIPAGGATAELAFGLTSSAALVDLYEATLYKIDGTELVPLREFTFTELPLRFDRAQGQAPGTRYVLTIRAIRGASANAKNADFTVWNNTQILNVTHTHAFTLD